MPSNQMWQSIYLQSRIFDDPNRVPFLIFFGGMEESNLKHKTTKFQQNSEIDSELENKIAFGDKEISQRY